MDKYPNIRSRFKSKPNRSNDFASKMVYYYSQEPIELVLSGVGAILRKERQRRQFSLEHVSSETRIPPRYLEAIEGERMADLPGIVFTRGFVRQYAGFLQLPADELLAQLPKVDV